MHIQNWLVVASPAFRRESPVKDSRAFLMFLLPFLTAMSGCFSWALFMTCECKLGCLLCVTTPPTVPAKDRSRWFHFSRSFENDSQTAYQENKALKKVLHDALATLNEMQRSLVLLKDYEGYSYEEIGEITKLTTDQVRVYLHRARLKLRNYLISPQQVL